MGRKKKEIKLKEPVRIREKRLSDGNISLYLDMYHKGARKKEGLKLYLVPETTSAARMQNANTRKLAEQIKAQRILDIAARTCRLGGHQAFTHHAQRVGGQVHSRGVRTFQGEYALQAQRTGKG